MSEDASSLQNSPLPEEPCRTSPLVAGFSICLKKMRFCPHALSFGHQYLCRHPEHAAFAVPPSNTPRKRM